MDESIAQAYASRSFTGHWRIQKEMFPQDFLGELLYDPLKGKHELTLYGICIFPGTDAAEVPVITGRTTTGQKVSVFDSIVVDANSGKGEILDKKTVFSFISFCIGDEYFTSKESVRLKKYSFRCSNLETWFDYQPIQPLFSSGKKRKIGTINLPPYLSLYEDDFVRIKLGTTLSQSESRTSLHISYYHDLTIEAKGNRKLPYFGGDKSFSYYAKIIHDFFCLVIGKHALAFNRIGTVKKQRIIFPAEKMPILPRGKRYSLQRVEFYNACTIDESWLASISPQRTLVHHRKLNGSILTCAIKGFFEKYSRFDFVLDDWTAMRNRSSYTNFSLPEMLYNFEGLHRSLYPECDTSSGYQTAIDAIHAVSPFKDYGGLKKNRKHELPFRQRLQDILLIRTGPIFQFLSILQKEYIIDDLLKMRNDAAHQGRCSAMPFSKIFAYIFLCEELIAVMIFRCIGLQVEQIREMLLDGWEWLDLKKILLKELSEAEQS